MKSESQCGFTLVELLLTTSVAMVLLGVGVPSFVGIVRTNETVTAVNELAGALNLARSEAIGRGVEITVAPRSGTDWTTGWAVGIDTDEDNVFPEAGEPVLRSFPAVTSLAFTAAPARIEFRPTGEVANLASFTMLPTYCDNNNNRRRVMSVAMAGYVDLQKQDCPP